ncbi:hypothetical protein DV515_00016663 [Chloebia gouldiae]|uniref:Small ribosomal subunit protein bS6m n=1 Tax=Chloebia gouldiae TaxID=44316 RepID=A0A3L8RT89_CHLGU|nr:hypothetical protein DV515_00016663 [Chloebia gouldiae]
MLGEPFFGIPNSRPRHGEALGSHLGIPEIGFLEVFLWNLQLHGQAGYFLIDLEAPPSLVSPMMDHLGRDIDVIRRAFIKHPVAKAEECSGILPVSPEEKLSAKKK